MRIAFINWRHTSHPLAGGAEVLIDKLASGLAGRGHEVAVLAGGPAPADAPYPVVDLGGTYGQYLRAPVAARAFKDWDVLVDSENGLPFFSPLWRRGPILTLVHHVHTDQWALRFPKPVAAVGQAMERYAFPAAYRRRPFVTVSESTKAALVGIGVDAAKISLVPVGVEGQRVDVPKSAEPMFVALGRLVPHKRVDLLLRAWERVRPVTGGRLVIIGDGPDRERLRPLLGVGAELAGKVDEETKWRLLAESWLLVHPAQHEGWGMVLLEAGVAGTPSLGFAVPGVRDAVVDGVSGALVDTEDQLVSRWIQLTGDPAERARLGAGAGARAAEFGWARTFDEFTKVLERAAG